MFRSTRVATLLVSSVLFVACSFNPLVQRYSQQATNPGTEEEDATENLTQMAASPVPASFNLFQEGQGRLTFQGRGDRALRAISISGQDAKAELAFEGSDGSLVRMSGNLVSHTPSVMIIDFTRSGNAEASGSVRVKYDAATLDSLTGNGILDGQSFSIEFGQNLVKVPTPPTLATANLPQSVTPSNSTSKPTSNASEPLAEPIPLASVQSNPVDSTPIEPPFERLVRPDINLFQQGAGVLNVAGQTGKSLSSAAVTGRESGRVDLVLHFADAEQIRLRGSIEQKNAEAMVVRLLNADDTAATGTVTIEYDADRSIHTLQGDGTLNTQPFSMRFSR